ncbi:MAG: 16S rRNA (adenine(1518)-N(6)/adenine(1519)-N(6))-dimethyltransferase, partial [Candidatus Omnitrophica bacterium]|nr:16S rRNA (adenine(1518)-N(6)/adenine(1519)-N(6))-dimethyltransferase [Candidatus Omnitrophota bacterium]
ILANPDVKVKDEKVLFAVIRQAFAQRRKKMVNSLAKGDFNMTKEDWERILKSLSIDLSIRAEDLSLFDFAKISDLVN